MLELLRFCNMESTLALLKTCDNWFVVGSNCPYRTSVAVFNGCRFKNFKILVLHVVCIKIFTNVFLWQFQDSTLAKSSTFISVCPHWKCQHSETFWMQSTYNTFSIYTKFIYLSSSPSHSCAFWSNICTYIIPLHFHVFQQSF